MGRFWKQGVALVRVAALVASGALAGCTVKGSSGTQVSAPASSGAVAGVMRVGVYDSRAVAVAYGRSKAHAKELQALMAEHQKAKAVGDTARVEELNRMGERQQVRLHLQAFSNAPVDDALEVVKERLPGVMEKRGVSLLTAKADAMAAGVEVVNVTGDIVLLFEPDAATLRVIAEMKGQDVMPIEQVAEMPANK